MKRLCVSLVVVCLMALALAVATSASPMGQNTLASIHWGRINGCC